MTGPGDYWHLIEQGFREASRPRWQWKWAAYMVRLKEWPGLPPVVVQWQVWRDAWMLDDGTEYPYEPHGMYDVLLAASRKLVTRHELPGYTLTADVHARGRATPTRPAR